MRGEGLFCYVTTIKITSVLVYNQDLRFDLSVWEDQETRVKWVMQMNGGFKSREGYLVMLSELQDKLS